MKGSIIALTAFAIYRG